MKNYISHVVSLVFLFESLFCGSRGAETSGTTPYPNLNPTNGTCVYDGLTMADPYDHTAYYQCCKHLWFFKYCMEGLVFDKYNLTCVPNNASTRHTATLRKQTVPAQVCIPGDRIENPYDDSKFDECTDGTGWVNKSCPSGQKLNGNNKQCQYVPITSPSSYSTDVSETKSLASNGGPCQDSVGPDGYKPYPSNCRAYYQCNHGQWQLRDCKPGTMWVQPILGCFYYGGSC